MPFATGPQYPVYKKCIEIFIWEVKDKFYRFAVDYEYTEYKGKRMIRISNIFLQEAE